MSDLVTITGIATGGDGVGRLADGRVVFVPRAAPGDRLRLRDGSLKLHRTFGRAEVGEMEAPGAARVTAPCPHYTQDRCGGCQLQHLSYDAQLAAKRAIVVDALQRIAKLEPLPDVDIVEAIEEFRYRAKIAMAVENRPGRRTVGLHPYDRPGSVFPVVDCQITDARLMALWRELRPRLDLFPDRLSRITLRLDREGRRHVLAESSGEPWLTAAELRAALPDGEGVVCWWQPEAGAARVVAGPETGFPATAFELVNPEMGRIARAWAVEQIGAVRGAMVWDLYGGIGDTAALLAARGAEVVSVDADERAIAWARRRHAATAVRFIAGRAEDVVPTLSDTPPDAVAPSRISIWPLTGFTDARRRRAQA